jgi:hypothetical protein
VSEYATASSTPAPGSIAAVCQADRALQRRSKQLTTDLVACQSDEEVLSLVAASLLEEGGAVPLNAIHVSTALMRLAKCRQPSREYAQDVRFTQLLSTAETLFDSMQQQSLANVLYACGKLRVVPSDRWLARYWAASQALMPQFSPPDFSNTLHACGLLALVPPSEWLDCYWAACKIGVEHFNSQVCSNILLSVAILSLWDCPVLDALWQKLSLAVQTAGSANRALNAIQLYQLHMVAAAEQPGVLEAPRSDVLEFARHEWRKQQEANSSCASSALHKQVSAFLTAHGVAHVNEYWCERSELAIDIVIETRTHRIALEVDGPYHFLLNGQADGPTRLRNRCLAAHGWLVVVLDYRAWDALRTAEQRDAHLTELLARALAAPNTYT